MQVGSRRRCGSEGRSHAPPSTVAVLRAGWRPTLYLSTRPLYPEIAELAARQMRRSSSLAPRAAGWRRMTASCECACPRGAGPCEGRTETLR